MRKRSGPFKAVVWEARTPLPEMLPWPQYFWNGSIGITIGARSSFFEYCLWGQISL